MVTDFLWRSRRHLNDNGSHCRETPKHSTSVLCLSEATSNAQRTFYEYCMVKRISTRNTKLRNIILYLDVRRRLEITVEHACSKLLSLRRILDPLRNWIEDSCSGIIDSQWRGLSFWSAVLVEARLVVF